MKEKISYIIYFFSWIVVYPISFPLLVIATFTVDDPNAPESRGAIAFAIYLIVTTIVGALLLNYFFRKQMSLGKNNIYSWAIMVAHVILILLFIVYGPMFLYR